MGDDTRKETGCLKREAKMESTYEGPKLKTRNMLLYTMSPNQTNSKTPKKSTS